MLEEHKLLFDQLFISLFSGSAAMFYFDFLLAGLCILYICYMFTMVGYCLITIVRSTNSVLFLRIHLF